MGASPETPRRSSHDRPSLTTDNGSNVASMSSGRSDDPLKRVEDSNNNGKTIDNITDDQRPPLPPRPSLLQTGNGPSAPQSPNRPSLQVRATTALSSLDIQTLSFPDGSRGTFSTPASGAGPEPISELADGQGTPNRKVSRNGSDVDDDASLMSIAPTTRGNGDLASLLDDELNTQSPAWRMLNAQVDSGNLFETSEYEDRFLAGFDHEFDEIEPVDSKIGNEG